MKLTQAQVECLKAVENGKVYEIQSMYIRRSSSIVGARKQTIMALRNKGLITFTPSSFQDPLYFRLTDAGKKALEEARK